MEVLSSTIFCVPLDSQEPGFFTLAEDVADFKNLENLISELDSVCTHRDGPCLKEAEIWVGKGETGVSSKGDMCL